jgi:hypothetical protein
MSPIEFPGLNCWEHTFLPEARDCIPHHVICESDTCAHVSLREKPAPARTPHISRAQRTQWRDQRASRHRSQSAVYPKRAGEACLFPWPEHAPVFSGETQKPGGAAAKSESPHRAGHEHRGTQQDDAGKYDSTRCHAVCARESVRGSAGGSATRQALGRRK